MIEFRADMAHSHELPRLRILWRRLLAGEVREFAIGREAGDSVLYHSLLELAMGKMFWGRALYEWPAIRAEREGGRECAN